MKIMLVSFHFAPSNKIGALRVSKMAKFFVEQGCDVRVLTTTPKGDSLTLPLGVSTDSIVRTEWRDFNDYTRKFLSYFQRDKDAIGDGVVKAHNKDGKKKFSAKLYSSLFSVPDNHWPWIFPAIKTGKQVIDEFKPDVIVASGGPFSTFIVASRLSKYADIPWVADYRDLWSENHAKSYYAFRRYVDRWLEKATVKNASLLVSVSPLLVQKLSAFHRKDTLLVMNGFDPVDYASSFSPSFFAGGG